MVVIGKRPEEMAALGRGERSSFGRGEDRTEGGKRRRSDERSMEKRTAYDKGRGRTQEKKQRKKQREGEPRTRRKEVKRTDETTN